MDQVGATADSVSVGPGEPPTVSIVVPAYNAAWSIERTLRSVQNQTLADFEAFVVDDGSTDDTAKRVEAAVGDDPRFCLIRQPNAGVGAARNRGLALARGRYFANLDADDTWRPEFLARTVASLEQAGPSATMAFTRSLWVARDDTPLSSPPPPLARPVTYRELLLYNPIGNGSSVLMPRQALVECGGWDIRLPLDFGPMEDWLLQLQLAARGDVVVVDEPLVCYRITESSASAALERCARAALEIVRRLQATEARLPRLDYWRARSFAMLWLLRRARRTHRRALMVWLAAHAYLRNPVWFIDRELREPLVTAIRKAPGRLIGGVRRRGGATASPASPG